jgi:hypothetical protein
MLVGLWGTVGLGLRDENVVERKKI